MLQSNTILTASQQAGVKIKRLLPPPGKGEQKPRKKENHINFIRFRPMAGLNSRSTLPAMGVMTISTVALITAR